jgi:hypothetical protein
MRAWKAVELSWGGRVEEVDMPIPGLPAKKAVQSPNWACTLAGPVLGNEVGVPAAAEATAAGPWVAGDDGWCELAIASPVAACGEALAVCPGSDPVAAAAAVPRPKVATVAAAATLAVNKRESTELLLDIDGAGGWDEVTAAAMAATSDALRSAWLKCAGPAWTCMVCTSAATPAYPGGASSGGIIPESRRSAVVSSRGTVRISL